MGQKTNPVGFRLAVRRNWQSRWYASKKDFGKLLAEDQLIRSKLMEKLKQASVPRIFIERASNRVRVKIYTARPGIVIGRKGQEIEKIKEDLAKLTGKEILLDIQEVKKPEIEALQRGGECLLATVTTSDNETIKRQTKIFFIPEQLVLLQRISLYLSSLSWFSVFLYT